MSKSASPLAEQQRIVGLLDEAFEGLATAKANAEKNLQNARALFESHLQAVFTQRGPGWVETTLGDLCDFLNGFAFKSGDAVAESQTQLVRMGNLYGNQLDLDRSPVFYPDSFATEHSRYVLEEGDIIMSLTGTTGKEDYGFAVRIPDCGHTLLMNQRIMKFDAIRHDIIDDGYLLHYGERYTASKPVERDDEVASSATAFPERTESHRSPTRRPVRRNPTPHPPLRAEARRAGGAEEGAAASGLCGGAVTERRRMPSIGAPLHGKKRRFPFHELANVIRKEPFLYRLRALAVNQVDEM